MALTFPLERGVFADELLVEDCSFRLREFEEISGTASGDVLVAQTAWPKWEVTVSLAPTHLDLANRIQSRLEALGRSRSVNLFNFKRPFPKNDPSGSAINSSNVTVFSVGSDRHIIRLTGMPVGYSLAAGDMFSISYNGRKSLHRVVEGVDVPGTGITPSFEIRAAVPAGVSSGETVDFTKPTGRFRIMSYSDGQTDGVMVSGMSFTAIEAFE